MENPEESAGKIRNLLKDQKWAELRDFLSEYPVQDIASLFLDFEIAERVLIFRLLPRRVSSEVFSYLEAEDKDTFLKELTDEETRHLLAHLRPDDRIDLFEELPGQMTQRLLNMLSPGDLKEARRLLGYPEESVGRLMTPDYIAVRPDWTIGHAIEHIRQRGKDSETISVVYVTDTDWKLIDALELGKFILADPGGSVKSIMDYTFVSIPAFEDREQAVRLIQRYDLYALPVVDSGGILLGIVTVDDVMDIAQEEITEDFQKVAAVTPLKKSYRESGLWLLYRKRIIWLSVLLVVNLVASEVIAAYRDTLTSAIALAFFIPLLIATGGNAGAQSATLIVRAIATEDIKSGQWVRPVVRDLGIGLLLGATMGLASWGLGLYRGGPQIALVVSAAMVLIVIVANFIGIMIPLALTKLGIDPAVASSPLITSLTDVIGLLIYFSIAALVLVVSG